MLFVGRKRIIFSYGIEACEPFSFLTVLRDHSKSSNDALGSKWPEITPCYQLSISYGSEKKGWKVSYDAILTAKYGKLLLFFSA